ncbi:MAG: lytic transglycosylase domain-containing protein [Alphaproteobacteria bacterium]
MKHKSLGLIVAVAGILAMSGTLLPASELGPADRAAYRDAFRDAARGDWVSAIRHAAKAREKLPGKALNWLYFKEAESGVGFAEIAAFVAANPDWPHIYRLRRRAEEAMADTDPRDAILGWFTRFPPITAPGSARYARALIATGQSEKAASFVRDAWISLNMTPLEERGFRSDFSDILRHDDHIARLDRLIWDRQVSAAQRQMRHVSEGYRNLAEARLMLMQRKGGVDSAIARIPDALRNDPGLVFERLRWRRLKNLTESAIELLGNPSAEVGRPNLWWGERVYLAREALNNGDITLAYRLARDHGPIDGAALAEAEWLAGWIALRFLNDSEIALKHFTTLYENVRYPISRARGAYWAGRAAEATGIHARAAAQQWYGAAATHFTTYYGQLALSRLVTRPAPVWEPESKKQDIQAFHNREIVRLTRMLAELEQDNLVEAFLEKLMVDAKSGSEWTLVAQFAIAVGRQDMSVRVAKQAIRDGIVLTETGYPALPTPLDIPANPALVHAVIRQESAFDTGATSSAGARGLMQLMPATARGLARQLNVSHSHQRLTTDPAHNLTLGSTYLAQLIEKFDGSIVLALASYNAGPSRVYRWLSEYGDPRDGSIHAAVDWVESIPYPETRNYVQRVLENLPIYDYRLQEEFDPARIVEALTGSNRVSVP